MPNLFEHPHPDKSCIRRVKNSVSERFHLSETYSASIAELRCLEKGGPSIETAVTAHYQNGSLQNWRIAKPIQGVTLKDVANLHPGRWKYEFHDV